MAEQNKMLKGMAIGALVGAAVTLFDRDTRNQTVKNVKGCSQKVWENVKHPAQTVEKISTTVGRVNEKIQNVTEEASFIMEKINELSEPIEKNNPQNELEDYRQTRYKG